MSTLRKALGLVSRKVLIQALMAAGLIIVTSVAGDTAALETLPDWIERPAIVVLPALAAWMKRETVATKAAMTVSS